MLVCRDAAELVTDYLERTLPPRAWLGVRWHLFRCDMCRNYYAQMRATVALLGNTPAEAPPAGTEARLLATLPGGMGPGRAGRGGLPPPSAPEDLA